MTEVKNIQGDYQEEVAEYEQENKKYELVNMQTGQKEMVSFEDAMFRLLASINANLATLVAIAGQGGTTRPGGRILQPLSNNFKPN